MRVWSCLKKTSRRGLPLWLEIGVVLLIKLMALFFLWKTFFSHPQTKHMRLPTPTVEQHMLSPSGPNSPNSPTPDGATGLDKRP